MTRTVSNRSSRVPAAAFLFLFLLPWIPSAGTAAEPFPGYPPKIREQARRLVDVAKPGMEEVLEPEVQSLRNAMFEHAILSVNAVPDRIYEQARKEGWTDRAGRVLRPITRVAPYSVGLWAWLIREDLATFGLEHLPKDLEGLEGALRQYEPSLPGIAAWAILLFSAAASWFAVWASVSLLLRAQPALTFDIARLFKRLPRPEVFAFFVFLGCLLGPVLSGAGIGAAALFWFFLSAGYVRRWELVTAAVSIFFLAAVFLFGGALQSITKFTGETRSGGWLGGEGYFPREWPDSASDSGRLFDGSRWEEMVKFARARAEMQAGNLAAAESLWTEWIREAKDPAEGYNNRGIVRIWSGKTAEALADFEESAARTPMGGPAYWNSYQVYLRTFRLEDAAKVQVAAWGSLRDLKLFDYRAEEMTHGELVPSPLRVRGVWKDLFTPRREWFRDAADSPVHRFLFQPLPGKWVPVFMGFGWIWTMMWKPLSRKIWMHSTCRPCGTRTLVVGGPENVDICNACRAQVGGGIRSGEERGQRILNITLHRRYVRACSILFPGAGAFWAGKDLSSMIYGFFLSLSLGVVTVSTGAGGVAPSLISAMLGGLTWAASAVVAVLWLFGAAWGWRSFDALQAKYNISAQR
jgi:tetratricopeptide (TPR) repeat protein